MIEQTNMIKTITTLSPAWVGTGLTLATLGNLGRYYSWTRYDWLYCL